MNYQLLIESYVNGTLITDQEIDLLDIELETQILNLKINKDIGCLKAAPEHVCNSLKIRKNSFWIICLAEILDRCSHYHKPFTRGVAVYHALYREGLIVG